MYPTDITLTYLKINKNDFLELNKLFITNALLRDYFEDIDLINDLILKKDYDYIYKVFKSNVSNKIKSFEINENNKLDKLKNNILDSCDECTLTTNTDTILQINPFI